MFKDVKPRKLTDDQLEAVSGGTMDEIQYWMAKFGVDLSGLANEGEGENKGKKYREVMNKLDEMYNDPNHEYTTKELNEFCASYDLGMTFGECK